MKIRVNSTSLAMCLGIAALVALFLLGSQDQIGSRPLDLDGMADGQGLCIDNATQNLGGVVPKSTHRLAIPVVNRGASRVTIKDVKTSCGCTVATLDARELDPGTSTVIHASFEAPQRHGGFHVQIAVISDCVINPIIEAGVIGVVGHSALQLSKRKIDLGEMSPGEFRELDLSLINSSDDQVNFKWLNNQGEFQSLRIVNSETESVPPRSSQPVKIVVQAPEEVGVIKQSIDLFEVNENSGSLVDIEFDGYVVYPYLSLPPSLSIRHSDWRSDSRSNLKRKVRIISRSGPLAANVILRAECKTPGVFCSIDESTQTITVEFNVSIFNQFDADATHFVSTIEVYRIHPNGDGEQHVVSIPLTFFGPPLQGARL